MTHYYELLGIVENHKLELFEVNMKGKLKGLYSDSVIFLKKDMSITEKKCVLCEEIFHHVSNYGDVLDKNSISARKQEIRARRMAYEYLLPIEVIRKNIDKHENYYKLAESLDVTEEFLRDAIDYYITKYGIIA